KNDRLIATHGRSLYVLENINILRQMTPEVASAKAHLFDPPPVIRSVNQAIVDYYLNRGADKVMIEILDGKGQVVRTFDSSVTAGSKQPQDSADEETPAPATVRAPTTRTGANHFVWDLR